MDLGQILDSKSYDQTKQILWYHTHAYPLGWINGLYLTQFLTDFSQILDSKSYD